MPTHTALVEGPFPSDAEYLTWIAEHPNWFVLTSNRSLTPRHTVIHQATCVTIAQLRGTAQPGGFTRRYIKVGGASVSSLRQWILSNRPNGSVRECPRCAGK
jgi:hypothetical protein